MRVWLNGAASQKHVTKVRLGTRAQIVASCVEFDSFLSS
jgi:hypothetical protein